MEKVVISNKPRKVKKVFAGLIVLLIILLAVGGVILYIRSKKNTSVVPAVKITNQCTNDAIQSTKLKNIKTIIATKNPDELKAKVDEIMTISGYQNDQNCLYPIAVYYLLIGDSGKARQYFIEFKNTYVSYDKSLKIYGSEFETPDYLKFKVESAEQLKKNNESIDYYNSRGSQ